MTEWDGNYPEDFDDEVAFISYLIQGWLKNMARDALGNNKVLSPEAVSEALGYLSDVWSEAATIVVDDDELERWING